MYLQRAPAGQTGQMTAIASPTALKKLAGAGVREGSIIRVITNHGPSVWRERTGKQSPWVIRGPRGHRHALLMKHD